MSASTCTALGADATLVDQADYLLTEGFSIAAGMLARSALEECLRDLCLCHQCEPEYKKARFSVNDAYLDNLRRAKVFDKATAVEAKRLFTVGSQIVHCEPVTEGTVETLVQGVRAFIDAAMQGGEL